MARHLLPGTQHGPVSTGPAAPSVPGRKRCKQCGQVGHNRRTCPQKSLDELSGRSREKEPEKPTETEKPKPPPVAERVRQIAKLMANLQWVRGVSAAELAEKWGLDENTVEKDSAEASRRLRESDEDLDAVRETFRRGALARIARCLSLSEEYLKGDKPRPRLALEAEKVGFEYLKLLTTTTSSKSDETANLTDEQAAALIRSLLSGKGEADAA